MADKEKIEIHRGLKGIYFERSATSDIDGTTGTLSYRGYSIHDLAEHSTFEETTYLLLFGELPTLPQLANFTSALIAARTLPTEIISLITMLKSAHPMEVLRTAISALAAFETSPDTQTKGIHLTAQVPMIIAAHHALRGGKIIPIPDASLGHAANFLPPE